MHRFPELRSLTSARLAVIPAAERDAKYASAASGWGGRPLLRSVDEADARCGQVGSLDLAVGLFVPAGGEETLGGLVAVRETIASEHSPTSRDGAGGAPPKRLVVIEALTLRPEMQRWQPPLRMLLAASAAILIATVAHDPSYRTYVACRVPADDLPAREAVEAIGGCELPRQLAPGCMETHSLAYLDAAAAGRAASVVLDYMEDGESSHALEASTQARPCRAVLRITFPRALRVLVEELVEVRAGRVALDWRPPVVVGNDVSLPDLATANVASV